jgi:hypothetical protein
MVPLALAMQEPAPQPAPQRDVQPAPEKDVKVDVNVNRGGGRLAISPVWIAIGVIGLVVVILLVAMAVRGGGSTVVK